MLYTKTAMWLCRQADGAARRTVVTPLLTLFLGVKVDQTGSTTFTFWKITRSCQSLHSRIPRCLPGWA
ncbi:hypothetical protein R1flu_020466 [Riccia fluitans]|uniref:Uncharacterized protein n=1 Tax=Riccia fluitans TaxID=41844 RepID=A0ABD1ZLT9_9MARC